MVHVYVCVKLLVTFNLNEITNLEHNERASLTAKVPLSSTTSLAYLPLKSYLISCLFLYMRLFEFK